MIQQRSLLFNAPALDGSKYGAPSQWAWYETNLTSPAPHELLVRSRRGTISMGTELALYRGETAHSRPLTYPRMTGYEVIGEVVACGAAVTDFAVGDRVVAMYGHRTYGCIAAKEAIPVPPDIPDTVALLVILACETAKGVAKISIPHDEALLITGAGTMGLLTLFNLYARGHRAIDIVEPREDRHQLAKDLGARRVLTPSALNSYPASTYRVGFECSAANDAFALLQQQLMPGGHLCLLADPRSTSLCLTPAFHEKELHLVASSDGLDYRGYAQWYWPHARRRQRVLENFFSATISFPNLPSYFATLATAAMPPVKVLIDYGDSGHTLTAGA